MIRKIKRKVKKLLNIKDKKQILSPNEQIQFDRVQPWFAANGDTTLRIDYELNENSVIFDLGGYKGEFATVIYCKYSPYIYVFEPIISFYEIIQTNFSHNNKVKAFPFGLSNCDEELQISLIDNSSSVFIASENSETIQLKSVVTFVNDNKIDKVALIKINIEGGEYAVLESLIESNLISKFENIQVQFHDFIIPNAKERMNAIQEKLSLTHQLTYQYEFIWENWKLK